MLTPEQQDSLKRYKLFHQKLKQLRKTRYVVAHRVLEDDRVLVAVDTTATDDEFEPLCTLADSCLGRLIFNVPRRVRTTAAAQDLKRLAKFNQKKAIEKVKIKMVEWKLGWRPTRREIIPVTIDVVGRRLHQVVFNSYTAAFYLHQQHPTLVGNWGPLPNFENHLAFWHFDPSDGFDIESHVYNVLNQQPDVHPSLKGEVKVNG